MSIRFSVHFIPLSFIQKKENSQINTSFFVHKQLHERIHYHSWQNTGIFWFCHRNWIYFIEKCVIYKVEKAIWKQIRLHSYIFDIQCFFLCCLSITELANKINVILLTIFYSAYILYMTFLLDAYHKVLIYIEHHSVCPLVGIGTPPPL